MGLPTLTLPSPAHIDSKYHESAITTFIGRKSSFRGFSASSLSSLALGRHAKRDSIGTGKSLNIVVASYREDIAEESRPPSLITDKSSLTSASSRSPSPEPSVSRLEAAFRSYSINQSPKLLNSALLPALSDELAENLEDADIDVLFKWWNHLLLLATPSPITYQAIHAIALHPDLRATMFWNAHYDLTLSTTLSQPATVLPPTWFANIITIGYLYHLPTKEILKQLFTDPTKVSSQEPWVKRAKNIEVFVEIAKHAYSLQSERDAIIEARLEEMIFRVIQVTTFPNHRLASLCSMIGDFPIEDCLVRIAERIRVFDCVAGFYLLDFLSHIKVTKVTFWIEVLSRIISTENHILQIRVFAYLYGQWLTFSPHADIIISPDRWFYFFTHWSGIVRDHYMRLLAYKVSITHPDELRNLLVRSFETSLNESCQLRDCLPGNPIPNKRFAVRPTEKKTSRWTDKANYKFVAEYIGKQWSLTSDQDAINFLDAVMDAARDGRLPVLSSRSSPLTFDDRTPFPIESGRKRLWTRSLSEWSTILDELDRFWRTSKFVAPRLEVEFPRWFTQRSTQVESRY